MKPPVRTALACIVAATVAIAAEPEAPKRLTAQRVVEFTAPAEAPRPMAYKVEIAGIGSVLLHAEDPVGRIESVREFIFPTDYEPPRTGPDGAGITPFNPEAFDMIKTGWIVRLSIKRHGRILQIHGVADFVEATLVPGGYGELAGPIHNERGVMLNENKLEQPKVQTTTTRFHLFALPGESYDVTFFRGAEQEPHRITIARK